MPAGGEEGEADQPSWAIASSGMLKFADTLCTSS
jgi:hypothetical protein